MLHNVTDARRAKLNPCEARDTGRFLHHLRQVRAPRATLVVQVSRLRGQSVVISSDQSKSPGVDAMAYRPKTSPTSCRGRGSLAPSPLWRA